MREPARKLWCERDTSGCGSARSHGSWTCRDSSPTPDRLTKGLVSLSGPVWLDDEQRTEGTNVTEQEWIECTDPLRLLLFLRGKASDRKLRLFGCACCRRIWEWLPDQSNRDLVAAVEDR